MTISVPSKRPMQKPGGMRRPGTGVARQLQRDSFTDFFPLPYQTRTLGKSVHRFAAPGQVNLIGEHTAYTGGFVLTMVNPSLEARHALLLNTRTLVSEQISMTYGKLASCVIVVANPGLKHPMAGRASMLRRREVEDGQRIVRNRFRGFRDLGDVSLDELYACQSEMRVESFLRCRHIVTENARVLDAKRAMLDGDPIRLGKLMTLAHLSEREDFECSIEEIDFLVDSANSIDGCYGARLTGGEIGGCTVSLVESAKVNSFIRTLKASYSQRFSIKP